MKAKDYDQFEKAFTAKAAARKAKGCEKVSIYRDPADRNSLVLYMKWDAAKQYQKDVAGVVDEPHVTFYEDSDVTRTN